MTKIRMFQTTTQKAFVLNLFYLNFGHCFGFRISIFVLCFYQLFRISIFEFAVSDL